MRRGDCLFRTPKFYTLGMRPSRLVLPLFGLALISSALAQSSPASSAGAGNDAEAKARADMFGSCGGVEAKTLPAGVLPGIYRGTLGQQAVTLELHGDGSQEGQMAADRYAYDRYGLDIALERARPGNRTAARALLLAESSLRDDADGSPYARACLDLVGSGSGLSGQWRAPDSGRSLPLSLSRVNVAALPLALPSSPGLLALRQKDPFTFLKLNRPWRRVAGGFRAPLSDVTYPRVAGGSPALNAALQDRQLSLAADALDCLSSPGFGGQSHNDYSGAGILSWKSPRLVSLHEEVEYYCGGAHPDNYTSGATLDARSGREVKLSGKPGTLWPGLSKTGLQKLYLAGYPKDGADADGNSAECLDVISTPEISTEYDNYTLYLTRAGLAMWPTYLPHVAGACAEVVTVPYASLRPLADPKSVYFRDLYSR